MLRNVALSAPALALRRGRSSREQPAQVVEMLAIKYRTWKRHKEQLAVVNEG